MINQERIVSSFLEYVQIPSPTKSEGQFAQFISEELKKLGFTVHIDNAGEKLGSDTGNVVAKLEGTVPGEPILFSSHMDTVSPGIGIKPIIKDGIISSDGTTILGGDDKAGIAAIVEAIKVVQEKKLPHGPIEIAFSIFEEGGLHGAKNIDHSQFSSKKVFVFDSSGVPGQIITRGPAQDKLSVKIIGKPAHAGVAPEEGISAVMVASEAIANMKLLRIDSETTANIGTINGGSVTNIVMPELTITAEARSLNNEKLSQQSEHMKQCFIAAAEKFSAEAVVEITRMYDAFHVDEKSEIIQIVKTACENIGVKPFTTASGGGSDTNIYSAHGFNAVNLGIGERKPHTLEEHLHIADLVKVSELVLELIRLHAK